MSFDTYKVPLNTLDDQAAIRQTQGGRACAGKLFRLTVLSFLFFPVPGGATLLPPSQPRYG